MLALGALLIALTGCVGGFSVNSPRLTTVETDPAGASLFVEGGFVGMTPASFHLPSKDRVDIRLELPGYLPQEDVLMRSKDIPPEPNEGVGWDDLYYYQLMPKGY